MAEAAQPDPECDSPVPAPDDIVVTGDSTTLIHRPDPDDPERPACGAGLADPHRREAGALLRARDLCEHATCFGEERRGGPPGASTRVTCPLCGRPVEESLADHLATPDSEGCPTTPVGGGE